MATLKKIVYFIFFMIFLYTSFACIPDWVRNDTPCFVNDTYIIQYYDRNNCNSTNYPYNYGWVDNCNYCNEDLRQIRGDCINGTQEISWIDYNFYSCCLVTNLSSDCSILFSPFNETTYLPCFWENLSSDLGNLSCQVTPNLGINDKEYCIAHIPLEYSNESFKCIAYVLNGYTNEILQTTPEYKEVSQTFFNLHPEAETRQYFTPANNIVNFYFTGKNLHPDNDYILTIECASSERILRSQMRFVPKYEDVSFVFFRTLWLMENTPYLIGGVIMLIILFLIGWAIYQGVLR